MMMGSDSRPDEQQQQQQHGAKEVEVEGEAGVVVRGNEVGKGGAGGVHSEEQGQLPPASPNEGRRDHPEATPQAQDAETSGINVLDDDGAEEGSGSLSMPSSPMSLQSNTVTSRSVVDSWPSEQHSHHTTSTAATLSGGVEPQHHQQHHQQHLRRPRQTQGDMGKRGSIRRGSKKHSRHHLDPDLLFPDLPRERRSPLPSLSKTGGGKRRSSSTGDAELGSLSPHRVLPGIGSARGPEQQQQQRRGTSATDQRPKTADSTRQLRRHRTEEEEEEAAMAPVFPRSTDHSRAAQDEHNEEDHQPQPDPQHHDPREMAVYLERAGVRRTVQKLVEELVLAQPDAPLDYMIDLLERDLAA
ncbi:hypothetical protein PTSG_05804 [Salpingoeca rosetta]|uniref:Uncharacterized protein n=1 Tax=Salpingoeca rosetta (strain ATCC 50818 / BSB-021) TaxID=946362 RepID=F2UCU4_SALR5|nr:uncharacterized protein PTSG_05804 [Salpingoeca rosetta]EGD74439.1 hypothetical protein PTSG_05804 [Salpingoeca rosetta]|eukprot:XP_004992696.1 hypothetical protein PTSG_05804 [Salpingoeca rosetta]